MASTGRPFPKGVSGNPAGRPPKIRALTDRLAAELSRNVTKADGTKISGTHFLAQMRVEAAFTGKLTLLDGTERFLATDEIIDLQEWIYRQVDGPPRSEVDVTSEGKALGSDLTDEERVARLAAIFESARARSAGSAPDDGPDALAPPTGSAD